MVVVCPLPFSRALRGCGAGGFHRGLCWWVWSCLGVCLFGCGLHQEKPAKAGGVGCQAHPTPTPKAGATTPTPNTTPHPRHTTHRANTPTHPPSESRWGHSAKGTHPHTHHPRQEHPHTRHLNKSREPKALSAKGMEPPPKPTPKRHLKSSPRSKKALCAPTHQATPKADTTKHAIPIRNRAASKSSDTPHTTPHPTPTPHTPPQPHTSPTPARKTPPRHTPRQGFLTVRKGRVEKCHYGK